MLVDVLVAYSIGVIAGMLIGATISREFWRWRERQLFSESSGASASSAPTLSLRALQHKAWQTSDEHGFHQGPEGRHLPTKLLLLVQKVGEAFDEIRDGRNLAKTRYEGKPGVGGAGGLGGKPSKPVGFPSEIADIVIRAGDIAEIAGFDLESAVREKMKYNRTRPWMHGRKM